MHMIGVDCYSKLYLYNEVSDYIRMCFFLCIHIGTYVFIIEIVQVHVLLDFTKNKIFLYRTCLEYVEKTCGSWLQM